MPWIRLNATNFRDYIAPAQEVDGPSISNPNRGVFGQFGDPEVCSATINGGTGDNHNTLINYYAFAYDNPFTTAKVTGVRVICIYRVDHEPTNTGWHPITQAISMANSTVTLEDGTVLTEIGATYPNTGGVQMIRADLAGPTIYGSDQDYRRDTPRSFEAVVPGTGTQEVILFFSGTTIFTPDEIQGEVGGGEVDYYIEVFTDDEPQPPTPPPGYPVYEMEKGWSFDGNYIPHFLELNWYWGDNPVDMTGMQKVRIHGLTKGFTLLQMSVNGMETDMLDYLPYYSEPQHIDLPRQPYFVNPDYEPVTNYTDTAARGLSVQMKFEGRNTDITRPEPSHVIQVLVIQSVPTGARAN